MYITTALTIYNFCSSGFLHSRLQLATIPTYYNWNNSSTLYNAWFCCKTLCFQSHCICVHNKLPWWPIDRFYNIIIGVCSHGLQINGKKAICCLYAAYMRQCMGQYSVAILLTESLQKFLIGLTWASKSHSFILEIEGACMLLLELISPVAVIELFTNMRITIDHASCL